MNWTEVIREMETERDQLSRAIDSLKSIYGGGNGSPAPAPVQSTAQPAAPTKRRGRPPAAAPSKGNGSKPKGNHKTAKAYSCGCGKSFDWPAAYARHKASCDEALEDDAESDVASTRHSESAPELAPTVPCLTCGEKFPNARALRTHQSRAHFNR